VVGREMPHSFPLEALRAQAIAARTYALSKKIGSFEEPFHVSSGAQHQVYGGIASEDSRTRHAVESTRGLILIFGMTPIEAYFHASCGGKTEQGADALHRDLPYLRSVSCPCRELPNSHWSVRLGMRELKQFLGTDAGASLDASVVTRSATGRVANLQLSKGRLVEAAEFRQRLGYWRVKSLDFDISSASTGTEIALEGRGYGHGAGLCQWGSKVLAEKGWSYERILQHYYPGTAIQRLY
jgi:stage II sporulation protein D